MDRCHCVTIESMRETYHLGCTPHWIQVLTVTRGEPWHDGVLLGVDGFIADIQLRGADGSTRLGTLWPDRLARTAMGSVRRDHSGRPWIRWSKRAGVLELSAGRGYPAFSVVDVERFPDTIEKWRRLPATCKHRQESPAALLHD